MKGKERKKILFVLFFLPICFFPISKDVIPDVSPCRDFHANDAISALVVVAGICHPDAVDDIPAS